VYSPAYIGANGGNVDNVLRLENGTYSGGSLNVKVGRIEIAGTNSVLSVSGLPVQSSKICYEFGKVKPEDGHALIWVSGTPSFTDTVLEMDAGACGIAGGGRVVLVDANAGSEAALRTFETPANVDWKSGSGTIFVQDYWHPTLGTRWQLLADITNDAGTMIILR